MSTQLDSIFQQLSCVGQQQQYQTQNPIYSNQGSLILDDRYILSSNHQGKDQIMRTSKQKPREANIAKQSSNSQKRNPSKEICQNNSNKMQFSTNFDKENKNRNCNKNLMTKNSSTSNLNHKIQKRKQTSKNQRIQSTNYVDCLNLPLSIDNILSPIGSKGKQVMTTMNRNNSNAGLVNQKTFNMIGNRPISPLSNGQNYNTNEQSYVTQDPRKYQCFSPSSQNQIINLRINEKHQLPPSHQKMHDVPASTQNQYSQQFNLINRENSKKNLKQPETRNNNALAHAQMTTLSCDIMSSQGPVSCSQCQKLENKIFRINLQFESFFNQQLQSPKSSTKLDPFELLEKISNHLIDFKTHKQQQEQEKQKLQSDVEKLIKNQESFEVKVKEMDDVYSMLIKEKQKLNEQKAKMDQIFGNQKINLDSYKEELKNIKEQASEFKKQIRRAVEKEVKDTIYRKYRDKDYIYDYPLQAENKDKGNNLKQINQTRVRDSSQNKQVDTHLTASQVKQRENELDKKESKLYEWEAQLFEKKMKLDNLDEQLKGKVEKLNIQKSEIQQNLKKLQILTKDYETILQKEYEMTKLAEEIRSSKQQIEQQKSELDITIRKITTQREHLQREQLDANKVDRHIARIKDQTQMIIEDSMSYLQRERDKCLQRMKEADELTTYLKQEKKRWAQGVNDQQTKLQTLVDEKREQVLVMEVSMRQQIKEIRERQELLARRENEFEEIMRLKNEEIEHERGLIEKEKEDVKCLMLEFEEKQGPNNRSASKNKKKYKKTNMPRQMPQNNNQQYNQALDKKDSFDYMLNSNNAQANPQINQKQLDPKVFKHQKSLSLSHDFSLNSTQSQNQLIQKPSQSNDLNQFQLTQLDQQMNTFNLDNLDDECLLLDMPKYAQTSQSKTPQINRKNSSTPIGMPPKPPSSILSQSTNKPLKKDNSNKNLSLRNSQNYPMQNTSNQGSNKQQFDQGLRNTQNINDLSLDQDQQLEQLLMISTQNRSNKQSQKNQALGKENDNNINILITDEDDREAMFNKNGQFQFDQYLASSQNDINLLNDDDEINFY
eukprot:403333186